MTELVDILSSYVSQFVRKQNAEAPLVLSQIFHKDNRPCSHQDQAAKR